MHLLKTLLSGMYMYMYLFPSIVKWLFYACLSVAIAMPNSGLQDLCVYANYDSVSGPNSDDDVSNSLHDDRYVHNYPVHM